MSDQERNYNDLFEIAIINSKPCTGELFNWAAFKASEVKEKKDLPPYLIFGPLDEGTLVINEDGWFAQWKDAEQKAKVTVNWRKDTKMYSVSQVWMGIEGSAVEASDDQPFPQVLASLYEDGFPKDWEQKAKEYFESKYRISWLNSPDDLPCTFGLPNGTFRVLEFPILIKNIRNAQHILMHLSEEHLPYGFFAVAQLTAQKVFYEVGKAPDWTNDIGLVLTQSIGETGLIPTDIPQREKIDEKDLQRAEQTGSLCFRFLFRSQAYLLCLRSLPRRPCRLLQRKKCRSEGSLHRSFFRSILMKLPTVLPSPIKSRALRL